MSFFNVANEPYDKHFLMYEIVLFFYVHRILNKVCLLFTEAVKNIEVTKPKAEDDLNAEETSSDEEDDLTQEGHELKDMLDREEGRESWDEEEEDPDQDEIKGTSALFLQGWIKRSATFIA